VKQLKRAITTPLRTSVYQFFIHDKGFSSSSASYGQFQLEIAAKHKISVQHLISLHQQTQFKSSRGKTEDIQQMNK
jgi:hypothetical protein